MIAAITERNPHELKNHPLNAQIYGDTPDSDFLEVCADGIREPIVITSDDYVISGHRRMQAARMLKHPTVPVRVRDDLVGDSPEAEWELLLANRHRNKSNKQLAREAQHVLRLREVLFPPEKPGPKAENNSGMKSYPNSKPLKNRDKKPSDANISATADALGIGKQKAKQAVAVAKEIDAARENGDEERAAEIETVLETKSVNAAYQAAKRPKQAVQPETFKKLLKVYGQLVRAVDTAANELGGKGAHYESVTTAMEKLNKLILKWESEEG